MADVALLAMLAVLLLVSWSAIEETCAFAYLRKQRIWLVILPNKKMVMIHWFKFGLDVVIVSGKRKE